MEAVPVVRVRDRWPRLWDGGEGRKEEVTKWTDLEHVLEMG